MKLSELFEQDETARLNDTQKAIIASMEVASTPELKYGVVTGARNAVSGREYLERLGYIEVDDDSKTAELTPKGEEVLTAENITDEGGELTDRGQELVDKFRDSTKDWIEFE